LQSYRVAQGILHNPKSDRRTTKGVFHIAEGGFPVPADKIAVPKRAFVSLLAAALSPPLDLMALPFTANQHEQVRLFVTLLLRPLVCPATGSDPAKTMEGLLKRLGLPMSPECLHPSFNGVKLEQVYPWGTIRVPTPEANLATANELSAAQKREMKAETLVMQRLLGYETPRYAHHHLLTDAAGRRFAKRDKSLTLRALRESGLTPAQVFGLIEEQDAVARPPA